MKRAMQTWAVGMTLMMSATAWASPPRQLRVIMTEDPAREATISWTTDEEGSAHTVHFDEVSRAGDTALYSAQAQASASGAYDEAAGPFFHHANLEGLKPDTLYHVVVRSDADASTEYTFRTAAIDDRPIQFLYGGDSRSDRDTRQQMNRRIQALFTDDILALLHGGDFIDDGNDWGEYAEWLDDHALTTRADGRLLPIIPTRGNHERSGELYNKVFGFPGGPDSNYFATSFGTHTTMLTLDSEDGVFGAQRDWLERQLISNQGKRYLLVGYHTPAWPAVKVPGPTKFAWVGLFERYKVDMAFENDGHALKRTVPILNEAQHPDGVVYVGEGGLGVKQRVPDETRWYLQAPGVTASAHHVQRVTLSPEKLRYEAVLLDGTTFDTWERTPRTDRMPAAFGVEFVVAFGNNADQVQITFSATLEPETVRPEHFTIEGLEVLDAAPVPNRPTMVRLKTSPHTEGKEYTLVLGESLRDIPGNALPEDERTHTFRAKGEPIDVMEPVQDMGPETEPPMKPTPMEPAPTPPMEPPPKAEEGGGCASSNPSAPVGAIGALGLAIGAMALRRRRRS